MLRFTRNYIRRLYGDFLDYFYGQEVMNLLDGDYFLKYEVPSITQWESKELTESILKGEIDTKDDPFWQKSGAENKEEYEMYSWQICGMACLKMILKSINKERNYKLIELAKDAQKSGVYVRNNNPDPKRNLDGLFHLQFLSFIQKFGLKGKLKFSVKEYFIAYLLKKNNFVIASVHPSIREETIPENSKKGHLVLLLGFHIERGKITGFFINNPSGYYNKSQEKHFVSIDTWKKVFSGNVDIVNPI